MNRKKWNAQTRRAVSILLAFVTLATTLATPVFAVHTYYWPDAVSPDAMAVKNWTWSEEGEAGAAAGGLTPTGLSQQETALMGGYTSKFWFQDEHARTITIPGTSAEIDFSKFHHRYFACADSHNTGFFAPVGAQIAFKQMYYPTNNLNDYPMFLKNAPMDMETRKFALLLISMLSSAYDTPTTEDLRDSDRSSMYYYLLWASIWSNDKYVSQGMFTGETPEGDWDFVQYFVRTMLQSRLAPDAYGSTAIYDAFRDGGPAEKYFFNCWKAAKFLSSFDYTVSMGNTLPVSDLVLGEDGMYHMTFNYGMVSDYEKEVYRRLTAEDLAPGWEYTNDGSVMDFKSADGVTDGNTIATLKLYENSEEDRFYNCSFGVGGLAGFQGCAKNSKTGNFNWGNTQVYFSAVSEPLELRVTGNTTTKPDGNWGIEVHRYEHSETWKAHYNILLKKYDSETGQPLAGSKWDVLEAFDDSQLDGTELESGENWANRGGSQFVRWPGWDYGEGNPDGDAANDPCPWDINVTNDDGLLMLGDNDENASEQTAHTDVKTYTYTKGYCGGHPEPEVEESGDPEIDAENNEAAQEAWQTEVDRCEALAAQGGFFHSLDEGEAKSQLESDRDEYYRQFISLKYDYSAAELSPRPGYTIHGEHTDDIPVEIRTVTSSEYKDSEGGENIAHSAVKEIGLKRLEMVRPVTIKTDKKTDAVINKPEKKLPNATGSNATKSNATPSEASASNAEKKSLVERLKALFEAPKSLVDRNGGLAERLTAEAEADRTVGNFEPSEIMPVAPGEGSIIDHTFIVYDHRTEGEVHINKQDLYLQNGERDGYDAYGDAMGDGTLEGAVYGLFALSDIQHPDGHTGTVYRKDDLTAIATTDRNGDASFMAFTEAPGETWNYKTGKLETRQDGFSGPKAISGDEDDDGNFWIGRPLIVEESGTTYYVKELCRSEGYELSVSGKTNFITNGQTNYEGEYQAADVSVGKISLDTANRGNYFDITAQNVEHDIILHGIDFPAGAAFAVTKIEKVPEKITVPVYSTVTKPVMAAAGAYVYREGQKVPAAIGDTVTFPSGQSYIVQAVSDRTDRTIGVSPMNYHTMGTPEVFDFQSGGSAVAFQNSYNKELDNLGYKEPGSDAPWIRVELSGITDAEKIAEITEAIKQYDLQYFNALRITDMELLNGSLYAVMRYEWKLFGDSRDDSVYVPEKDRLYLKKDSGNGYFVYAVYENPGSNPAVLSFHMKNGFLNRAALKEQNVIGLDTAYPDQLPDTYTLETVQTPAYWVYAAGEQQLDDAGNLKYTEETTVEYVEQESVKEVERNTILHSAWDDAISIYKVTLPAGVFANTDTVKVKVSDDGSGKYSEKQAYINQSHFAYIPLSPDDDSYVVNVTLTRPPADQPWQDENTRTAPARVEERPIMQKVKIVKDIAVDAAGRYEGNSFAGSGQEDGFTNHGGGIEENAAYKPNFRFKIYLKSNLEQLYRSEDGTIEWQDRNGNSLDISAARAAFPEKVQKIYTKVPHSSEALTRRSNDEAVANRELYSYTNGLINEVQNDGYTAVLEYKLQTVKDSEGNELSVSRPNYEKFFDAVSAANQDKWDKEGNESTSFKPFAFIRSLLFGTGGAEADYPAGHNNPVVRNEANTSKAAKENGTRSDRVRQFAITWYLDDEVKKLVKENKAGEAEAADGEYYQDEVYDAALFAAIAKAENYLKPFFAYDLDEIYAVEWDCEPEGGRDGDKTTLSADREDTASGYCYGVSEYLPYGTYVAVEQQPGKKELGDFYNKHYQIDAPKELELPAVYEDGKNGADEMPERLSDYYNYNPDAAAADQAAKYFIRFREERPEASGADLRDYIIKAHGYYGDYEIYKYGLDLDNLAGRFEITQSEYDPMKDYYNTIVDSETAGGNPDSHYLADDVNHGKTAPNGKEYERDGVEKIYHYGSVSEDKQIYNQVPYPVEHGEEYRNHVIAMEGMQTAYEGRYAPMLVPWSVTEPADELADMAENPDGSASCIGYGYRKFRNTFYTGRLRIEKLDSETGESILHDGAVFTIYAADREDGEESDGLVKFYKNDTRIRGSREFLEAMGASQITRAARSLPGAGELWTGIAAAGTPVCREDNQVIMMDAKGRRTGEFEAYTTTRDGIQAEEENREETSYQNQNTGYLVTPQPLGAGTYVLCEVKPPAGYARTAPIAVEVYSDKVSYYLNGDRNDRVTAAVYEDHSESGTGKPGEMARIYAGNTPIRLEMSKIKTKSRTVTYKTDTRLEGTEAELNAKYGKENLEYAYKNGTYLGYGWHKGTLEYLESRRAAGEEVNPVYIEGIFAGYGLITRPLDTADDVNRYAAGARLTLYDAIEIRGNGDGGDYGYDGVEIVRDRNHNVKSMKVLEGYAGSTVEFVNLDDIEGSLSGNTGSGNWSYRTIERGDTDILYYSLAGLKVTETDRNGVVYGFDRYGRRIQVKNQSSIYALKNGKPVFELFGGNFEEVEYSPTEKVFRLPEKTLLYHVDTDGNRDSLIHPTTGMAYTTEKTVIKDGKTQEKILVWPVNVSRTAAGAVIAQEKIKTYRIASIHADTESEYTIGTYDGTGLKKYLNPVIDSHGLPEYYQMSEQVYVKGEPVYDIDHDYVRYRYYDLLPAFNRNAYRINSRKELLDIGKEEDLADDRKLYHRQGEAWIMENTWLSGERYPNDPFKDDMTAGQADTLKRVIPGMYILEETAAADGYVKSFPAGITILESDKVQKAELEDEKIKIEIVKTDAPAQYRIDVTSDYQADHSTTEPKGAYGYGQIAGAHLALYNARRVYTADTVLYPKGYYLVKIKDTPAEWTVENSKDNSPVTVVAEWITDGTPKYFEGIPAGDYILEEKEAASGYIRSTMDIEVKKTGEVQTYNLKNDHTKLEVYKYCRDEDGVTVPLPNDDSAELTLYRAKTDNFGNILIENGIPQYYEDQIVDRWDTDDLKEYTELYEKSHKFVDRLKNLLGITRNKSSFISEFETAYKKQADALRYITWYTKTGVRSAEKISSIRTGQSDSVVQLWETDESKRIRITIYRNVINGSLDENGQLPLNFEYQFNYRELMDGMKSYDILEGLHRIDYLPFTDVKDGQLVGNYVLAETKVPSGFVAAKPKAVTIRESGAVLRVSLENRDTYIDVIKMVRGDGKEVPASGAKLSLYRGDISGNLTQTEEYLMESWISGSDGRYTEEDRFDGKIPEGFFAGDIKPHRISKVPYGVYYIVETEVPDYMAKAEPVRVEVGSEMNSVIKVINTPTTGRLEIIKTASDTKEALENARFEICNRDTSDRWYLVTGRDGRAVLENLPVGIVQSDGTIEPYTYRIEEVSPPDLYQITGKSKTFRFDGTVHENTVTFTYEMENRPTEIHFTKTNFDTGVLVAGAEVSVYAARAEGGTYVKDGPAIETVITGTDGFKLRKKLTAGHAYILEEEKAPAGMNLSKPVIFTVNRHGTGISSVTNDFSVLKVASDNGAVEALTVTGRVPTKVSLILKDITTGKLLPEITAGGTEVILTAGDGIESGHVYEISEYTRYSDGNRELSDKETRRLFLDQYGQCILSARTYIKTVETLKQASGEIVEEWEVSGDSYDHTIANPIAKEKVIAGISAGAGAEGSAVKTGDVIKYWITYKNPYNTSMEIRVKAKLSENLEYMRSTAGGSEANGLVSWTLSGIGPHESGELEVVAAVIGAAGERIDTSVMTEAGEVKTSFRVFNPIAQAGSLTIVSGISGTGKNPVDTFNYQIRFTNSEGQLLKGYQNYSGAVSGRIKGEGMVTLGGDEFIVFEGLPYGTRFTVLQEQPEDYTVREQKLEGSITRTGISAVFQNEKNDDTLRDMLKAGEKYVLTETTYYSDGTAMVSGRYRFRLNANGIIDNVDLEDRPVQLFFSKIDIDTSEEIAGGHYTLLDAETGAIVYEYTKEAAVPVQIPAALLIPGKEYVLREELPPDGYACEEEIRFTVNEKGIPETVIMQDKKTLIYIEKVDTDTGEALSGGRYSVKDRESGDVICRFTADGKPVVLEGILAAGKEYELIEEEPPEGYAYCQSIIFTVPMEPEKITVVMRDPKTTTIVEKLTTHLTTEATPSEVQRQLPGFVLQILNRDKTPAKAIRDGSGFFMGEELIFTTTEEFKAIRGQLKAGCDYWLHEVKPRDGYAFAEDVLFTVAADGINGTVIMVDKPTHAILSKKDITGSCELPGNHMSVQTEDGTVVERWVSGDKPHEITARLTAGRSYYLCEEKPADGYAYSEKVLFTVSEDGSIDLVEMRNDMTRVRIHKIDESGKPVKGAVLQILDSRKERVLLEFETTGEPVDITGKLTAGETYYLHEKKAPPGYLTAADTPFTVPGSNQQIDVTMTDLRWHESEERTMYLMKTDAETGEGLEGFEFTVTGPTGAVFTVITGSGGKAEFTMPADGTYTYRETKGQAGYLISEETYTFTIVNGRLTGDSVILIANQPIPQEPDDSRKTGRITASYKPVFRGIVSASAERSRPSAEKTGDNYPLTAAAVSMLLCLGGLYFSRRGRRK